MVANTDNFYTNNKAPDALYPYCKECTKKKSYEWVKNNKERYEENRRKHFQTDKFKYWQKKNQIQMKEVLSQWRKDNKDKVKEYNNNRAEHKKHSITKKELQKLYEYANYSCMYCGMSEELS